MKYVGKPFCGAFALVGPALLLAVLVGCSKNQAGGPEAAEPGKSAATKAGHTHGEWWCAEHGVPEHECGQCSATVAAKFQKEDDWCKTHDRPDSQCFVCHPEREADFAAKYEAKYGKKPPKPEA